MSTGEAWNRCGITEAEYFRTEDKCCPYVDENGNDNGKFDELMREYEESHRKSDEEKKQHTFCRYGLISTVTVTRKIS
jgi:hypothetical protein